MQLPKYFGAALLAAALAMPLPAKGETEVQIEYVPNWCKETVSLEKDVIPGTLIDTRVYRIYLTCKTEDGGMGVRTYNSKTDKQYAPTSDFIVRKPAEK